MARLVYELTQSFYNRDTAMAAAREKVIRNLRDGVYDYRLKDGSGKFDVEGAARDLLTVYVEDSDGNKIDEISSWQVI